MYVYIYIYSQVPSYCTVLKFGHENGSPSPTTEILNPLIDPERQASPYSRSPTVGNPIASIPKSQVQGICIPALIVLNPVSNFCGFTSMSLHPRASAILKTLYKVSRIPGIPDVVTTIHLGLAS